MKRLEHESQQQEQHLWVVEQFAVFQKKIGQSLDRLSFEDKRRILQLLVTEVAVDSVQGEITIKHILTIDETLPLHSRGHGAEWRAPEHRSRAAQRAACRSAARRCSRQPLAAASAESEGP